MAPFEPALLDALEAVTHNGVNGVVWRQVLAPSSVTRPNQRGGRWNPPGTEALYCSLEASTAAAEIDNLLAAQPVPITRQRYTYSIEVQLSRVADLRGEFAYDYDIAEPAECARVGDAAAWLGLSGLIVPSVRADGTNMVIYVTNLASSDSIGVRDEFAYPPGPTNLDDTDALTFHP